MKIFLLTLLITLIFISCHKDDLSDGSRNDPTPPHNNYVKPVRDIVKLSSISVFVNGNPLNITSIKYDRSSSTFNFTAQNLFQRVDVYCFRFYESSRWNYQYQDSINYSVRADSLSDWLTTRANNWGSVYFDCCYAPLEDSVVTGEFSGLFSLEGKDDFTVGGNFHLVFK